jgi:CheY-like chemotaxis protein
LPTLRSVAFRFRDISALSDALSETRGSLPLPDGETVSDGEWVLAIFEIGSRRRATAAAARGVRAAGDTHLEFERRDWDRLVGFVAARSEHMRAAKPVSASPGRVPAPPESSPPMSELPPSSALASSRVPLGARVLVIDDDPGTGDELRAMLSEIGVIVEVVESGEVAKRRLGEHVFDALVLDFHAPRMDPRAFVRELRTDPLFSSMPVLFLSSSATSREVVEAFASGADDFLPKPFHTPELGARIFGLLRRARIARAQEGAGR